MTARALVLSVLVALPVFAVGSSPRALSADEAAPATYSLAELNELVGPVALYPDVVLAAMLPATTVPTDLAAAAKYMGEQGGKATAPPAGVTWDTSVMGLMAYPAVLTWLSSNPDWVKQMGFAMAAQQADVLAAIQVFRQTAQGAGNLTSNEQQTVSTQDVDGGSAEVIVIEPTNPEVVYVPTYVPTAVTQPGYTGWAWGAGFVMGATTAAIYNNNHNSVNWSSSGGTINVNTGNVNTGNINTGNVNTGNINTGNVNTGNVNRGNVNTGNANAGNVNRGNANASSASGMGPNRGTQWQAPGGAATKPAAGGAGTKPAAGGAGTKPAAGGAGTKPAAGGAGTKPASGGAGQKPPAARPSAAPAKPASGFGGAGSGSQARAQSSRGADSLKQSGGGASGGSYKGQSGRSTSSGGGKSGGGGGKSSGGGGKSGGGGGGRRR